MSSYPSDRKYTSEHEWARPAGDSATVGITRYAQESLGDVVYVELPKIGAVVAKGDQLGVVESTKAVSELFAPVSGTVTRVNDALVDAPETLAQSPHETWMVELRLSKPDELDALLDAEAYAAHAAASAH